MSEIYLEIREAEGSRKVPLAKRPLTLGRGEGNNVELADERASRRHCVIELRLGGAHLRDLGSRNGTLLNGQPVKESFLRDGDEIAIGRARIWVIDPATSTQREQDEIVESSPFIGGPGSAPDPKIAPQSDDEEELTEEDVVEVGQTPGDDTPISMLTHDGGEPLPALPSHVSSLEAAVEAPTEQFEATLSRLADSLAEKPFPETAIGIMNARGIITHAAGASRAAGQRRETVDLLRQILLICARTHATDIHLEPKTGFYLLRIRVDGGLIDVTRVPSEMGVKLAALVKIMCDIDVTQRTIVQEGHFSAAMPAPGGAGTCRVDYRISFAPSVFGQKMVVRIFDASYAPLKITDLQLPVPMQEKVAAALQKQSGMFLVCGPTGSGKTTTLYALVRTSDVMHNNVVTIEDPVEVQLENVTQMQVDDADGKSFSALLRSVLRQDPDCILVGEIRDPETAHTAMQAAVTGHMVFSTVHTTNAVGTIFRLLDLGVEPYMVAQGLHLVLAQRLVRQLCRFCKKPVKPTPAQLAAMGPAGANTTTIYSPLGCPRCLGTGHAGRRAFFELLDVESLRDLIMKVPTLEEIRKALDRMGFESLEQSGYALVAEGVVSFDEINSAVGK